MVETAASDTSTSDLGIWPLARGILANIRRFMCSSAVQVAIQPVQPSEGSTRMHQLHQKLAKRKFKGHPCMGTTSFLD